MVFDLSVCNGYGVHRRLPLNLRQRTDLPGHHATVWLSAMDSVHVNCNLSLMQYVASICAAHTRCLDVFNKILSSACDVVPIYTPLISSIWMQSLSVHAPLRARRGISAARIIESIEDMLDEPPILLTRLDDKLGLLWHVLPGGQRVEDNSIRCSLLAELYDNRRLMEAVLGSCGAVSQTIVNFCFSSHATRIPSVPNSGTLRPLDFGFAVDCFTGALALVRDLWLFELQPAQPSLSIVIQIAIRFSRFDDMFASILSRPYT
jgi:hypothetical protein